MVQKKHADQIVSVSINEVLAAVEEVERIREFANAQNRTQLFEIQINAIARIIETEYGACGQFMDYFGRTQDCYPTQCRFCGAKPGHILVAFSPGTDFVEAYLQCCDRFFPNIATLNAKTPIQLTHDGGE